MDWNILILKTFPVKHRIIAIFQHICRNQDHRIMHFWTVIAECLIQTFLQVQTTSKDVSFSGVIPPCYDIKWFRWVVVFLDRLVSVLTLYTLTSVCIFSILFSIYFLRCWRGEFLKQSRASSFDDHFLYSRDFLCWFRGDTVMRN